MTTQNNATQTKDQLLIEKRQLIEKLDGTNHKKVMQLLKENEQAIKEVDKRTLLNGKNAKYSRLREMALQAWECEQPTEDITTNDGSFHKTRVKKYPKLSTLTYAYAVWKDNRITELRINGEKFYMFKGNYEYGKENTYTRPETFSEFLALNSIPEFDFTVEQYNAMTEKLNELNEKLQKNIKEYEAGCKALKISSLNYWGIVGQHNVNLYEYLPTVR